MLVESCMSRDYYAILGISSDASFDQVKQAYRKLARKFHPDVNPGNRDAEERFKDISAAFDVLGDPKKRALYDEFGEDGLKAGFDPDKARTYRDWQRRTRATDAFRTGPADADAFRGAAFDLGDLFGDMAGFRRERPDQRGADLRTELTITFREAILGGERDLDLVRPTRCASCGGTGETPTGTPHACGQCDGTGHRTVARGPISFQAPCTACQGTGHTPGPRCATCRGTGQTDHPTHLKVRIPAGVDDGQTIRLAGQGLPGTGTGPAGDLLIRISVSRHPLLRRQGRDLYLDLPITVREAMQGATVRVPTLTGTISVTVPPGIQSGKTLRARGHGVPPTPGHPPGDLHLSVRVQVPGPGSDPEAARRAADALEKLYGRDVREDLSL